MAEATVYVGRERRRARPSPPTIALAVIALAAVAFVTLCPIGLRPHMASANAERFDTYLLLGVLVARVAGRRGLIATAIMVLLPVGLEAAQILAPGRHAAASDAVIKALGGVFGVAAVQLSFPLRRWVGQTVAALESMPTSGRRA